MKETEEEKGMVKEEGGLNRPGGGSRDRGVNV